MPTAATLLHAAQWPACCVRSAPQRATAFVASYPLYPTPTDITKALLMQQQPQQQAAQRLLLGGSGMEQLLQQQAEEYVAERSVALQQQCQVWWLQ